jgi:hypothetical protein
MIYVLGSTAAEIPLKMVVPAHCAIGQAPSILLLLYLNSRESYVIEMEEKRRSILIIPAL